MPYTLGQAAKATGISTLKAGRISGEKDATGAYSLDPAEVDRVFPPVTERDRLSAASAGRDETPAPNVELQLAHAKLEAENAALQAMLEDMRVERDRWHAQVERLALAPPVTPRRTPWRVAAAAALAALAILAGLAAVRVDARKLFQAGTAHQLAGAAP